MWNFQAFMMKFTKERGQYLLQGSIEAKQKELEMDAFEKLIHKSSCSMVPMAKYLLFTQRVPDMLLADLQLPV